MVRHILKEPTDNEGHPRDILTWCGERIWKHSGEYTFIFMLEHWIDEPQRVKICKDCWDALYERIGEK